MDAKNSSQRVRRINGSAVSAQLYFQSLEIDSGAEFIAEMAACRLERFISELYSTRGPRTGSTSVLGDLYCM